MILSSFYHVVTLGFLFFFFFFHFLSTLSCYTITTYDMDNLILW